MGRWRRRVSWFPRADPLKLDLLLHGLLGELGCGIILALSNKILDSLLGLLHNPFFIVAHERNNDWRKLWEAVVELGNSLIELFKAHAGFKEIEDSL